MPTRDVAVMLIIRSDDTRLDPSRLDVSTEAAATSLRDAVLDNVGNIQRVVCVMPVDTAKLMTAAHEIAVEASGMKKIQRPPPSYASPADRMTHAGSRRVDFFFNHGSSARFASLRSSLTVSCV